LSFSFLLLVVLGSFGYRHNKTLGVDHVKMSEQCSAAIANRLEKQKDPGCPTIPCSIGSFKFEKALCNLGASVSVMPRYVFEKLCLPLEPTGMFLELGDNSIHYPLGIAEDVPVKVLTVYIRVKVHVDLQEDKSPVVVKEPFFPRVVNPRYRIRGTNV
jgi:hypothetical protein